MENEGTSFLRRIEREDMSDFNGQAFQPPAIRDRENLTRLGEVILAARAAIPFWAARLPEVPGALTAEALADLPVLRKSDLPAMQAALPPFGGLTTEEASAFPHLFLSPGPICEPGGIGGEGARGAMRAAGLGRGDILLNTFGYHLTPAGLLFDTAAREEGLAVIPAGGGNTQQILAAIRAYGPTAYVGTPDYLNILLNAADEAGVPSRFRAAVVTGAALPASLRAAFARRGIETFEQYGTAELGIIASETASHDGMVLAEGLIAEIVEPGGTTPMPEGEIGELVVSLLRPRYPLIRFATGDLSAFAPGQAASGHTNRRLRGWLGRADDAVKVKGMFLRPSMLAEVRAALGPDAPRARFEVTREEERDRLVLRVEGAEDPGLATRLNEAVRQVTRVGCDLLWEPAGTWTEGAPLADLRAVPARG